LEAGPVTALSICDFQFEFEVRRTKVAARISRFEVAIANRQLKIGNWKSPAIAFPDVFPVVCDTKPD
jgi:hypothetical protein